MLGLVPGINQRKLPLWIAEGNPYLSGRRAHLFADRGEVFGDSPLSSVFLLSRSLFSIFFLDFGFLLSHVGFGLQSYLAYTTGIDFQS